MSISTLQWIVIAVVLYTSVTMFRRAMKKPEKKKSPLEEIVLEEAVNVN